jgi:hypothetical protein
MLKYKVSEIYILSIKFHKIFLSVNANSYTTCAVKQNLLFAKWNIRFVPNSTVYMLNVGLYFAQTTIFWFSEIDATCAC